MRLPIYAAFPLLLLVAPLLMSGCKAEPPPAASGSAAAGRPLRVGHPGSPLLGPLYAAAAQPQVSGRPAWELTPLRTGGDIGYALLSGQLDAGFVETEKARRLLAATGGEQLRVAGAVNFPYGATLVLRKDLQLRLGDLAGRHLAALEPDCVINHQFRQDAVRHGLDPDRLRYSYMPFAEMLPALESKAVDGALVKGAYGVLAELAGHKILYQNWDITARDDCCPASLAQTEFFLVVREPMAGRAPALIRALEAADALAPGELRAAVARQLGYPSEALERIPVGTFARLDDAARKTLGEQQCAIIP